MEAKPPPPPDGDSRQHKALGTTSTVFTRLLGNIMPLGTLPPDHRHAHTRRPSAPTSVPLLGTINQRRKHNLDIMQRRVRNMIASENPVGEAGKSSECGEGMGNVWKQPVNVPKVPSSLERNVFATPSVFVSYTTSRAQNGSRRRVLLQHAFRSCAAVLGSQWKTRYTPAFRQVKSC